MAGKQFTRAGKVITRLFEKGTDPVLATAVVGDSFERIRILADGTIEQGDGASLPVPTTARQILLRNPADSDFYAISVGAGTTALQRRYFQFVDLADATTHLIGANASNQFIVFDGVSNKHILVSNPVGFGGGVLQINAAGGGAINFNGEIGSANGGIHVYSGGAAPARWHALDGTGLRLFQSGVERIRMSLAGNVGIVTTETGSGFGVLALGNALTAPSTNPTAAVLLYSEAGVLKVRTPTGVFTVNVTPA